MTISLILGTFVSVRPTPIDPSAPFVVSRSEAMHLLGISLHHTKQLIDEGELTAERRGSRWYVTVSSIDTLAARWRGDTSLDLPANRGDEG